MDDYLGRGCRDSVRTVVSAGRLVYAHGGSASVDRKAVTSAIAATPARPLTEGQNLVCGAAALHPSGL